MPEMKASEQTMLCHVGQRHERIDVGQIQRGLGLRKRAPHLGVVGTMRDSYIALI